MTRLTVVPANFINKLRYVMKGVLFLGIDVSKGYADFVVLDYRKGLVMKSFQLDDTHAGHSKLYSILSDLVKERDPECICSGVESTGGYENNWLSSLRKFSAKLPIKATRLNPSGVHFTGKATLKSVTTDSVSAVNIAEYMIVHHDKTNYEQNDEFADLRHQWKFVQMLKSQKVQYINQLESNLYAAFPEILRYCKNGYPQWVLTLLTRYPTAERLARAHVSSVSSIKMIKQERAVELIKNAKSSVASLKGTVIERLIRDLVKQISLLEASIKEQVKLLAKECKLPELDILKSFTGIKDWSAIGLLIEMLPLERFSDVKKLVSHFGINPAFKESGDGKSKAAMSKQGRVEPRRILFMIVLNGIQHNPLIRRTYRKFRKMGKSNNSAMGACMHKVLRVLYGMLKNKTMFNEQTDIDNIKSSLDIVKGNNKVVRRYQNFEASAPISRRQYKKREAESTLQNDTIIEYGVVETADM